MDALEFLSERRRMCNCYKDCCDCPLEAAICTGSSTMPDEDYKRIIAIVEQWSKEHPIKTRQSEFLKMFPNVMLNSDGQPYMCPRTLDTEYHPDGDCILDVDICQSCKAKFWGQEVD